MHGSVMVLLLRLMISSEIGHQEVPIHKLVSRRLMRWQRQLRTHLYRIWMILHKQLKALRWVQENSWDLRFHIQDI